MNTSPSERLFYKLGSKAAQGEFFSERLRDGESTIKDRWVIDVLADESHKGVVTTDRVFDSILRPNLAVLLHCNENVRTARMNERLDATAEDLIPCIPGERAYYFQEYLLGHIAASADDYIQLDSSELSPFDLAELVLERAYE